MWQVIYLAVLGLSMAAGAGFFAQTASRTNVDWIFVFITLVTSLALPSIALRQTRSRTTIPFRRPSFKRGFEGGWRTDPLQCLRVTILVAGGYAVGASLSLPHASAQGIMMFWFQLALFLGLALGERVAYGLFRRHVS